MTDNLQQIIERDHRRLRTEALTRRILDGLRQTIQVRRLSPEADDVRVECTTDSAAFIAPLVEAVELLEAIIWASDGCMGHRHQY